MAPGLSCYLSGSVLAAGRGVEEEDVNKPRHLVRWAESNFRFFIEVGFWVDLERKSYRLQFY